MTNHVSKSVPVRVQVVLEPDEGGYHAYCPALKGLHVSGATKAEALENAREAIHAYLTSLMKHGEPGPVGCLDDPDRSPRHTAKQGSTYHKEDLLVACA